MADLDKLLSPVAAEAAAAATTPAYDTIVRVGRRRQRGQAAGIAVAAALSAVAVIVAVAPWTDPVSAPPAAPSPTPVPAPSAPAPTTAASPESVVDAASARPAQVVVSPLDPDVRAVLWDSGDDQALAVTADGFRTRTVVPVPSGSGFVGYLGEDLFSMNPGLGMPTVIRGDGTVIELGDAGPTSPPRTGEVIFSFGSGIIRWVALNPRTGATHLTDDPPAFGISVEGGGTLRALGRDFFAQSDDYGATWQQTPLEVGAGALPILAQSPSGSPIAVIEGGDGATLVPLNFAHRSTDGGRTFERIPLFDEPMAYGGSAGVLPDGRLALAVESWSDTELGKPEPRPVGLYVSNGDDWSDLSPAPNDPAEEDTLPQMIPTPDGLDVLAVLRDGKARVSPDAGETWEDYRLR